MRGLLILNAQILTMRGEEIYEAMAIVNGVVSYLGSTSNAERLFSSKVDRVVELDGNLVTPGFIDSHCHLAGTGYLMTRGVDLGKARSFNDVKELLREAASKRPKGSWIYGYGLNEDLLKEKRLPRRWDLDEVSPEHPVAIEHVSGHLLITNTKALKLARVTAMSPPGGLVEIDDGGSPTGLLYDSAMNLVFRVMPGPTVREYTEAILRAQEMWIKNGFTGAEDAGVLGLGEIVLNAYLNLAKLHKLKMKIRYS